MNWQLPIGAQPEGDGARFRVWAPDHKSVDVVIVDEKGQEQKRQQLERDEQGYFAGHFAGLPVGSRYFYQLDGGELRPDPASRYQPAGVHGPSQVVDPGFAWTDAGWNGIPLGKTVIYEVHIGTATPEGTFAAFIEKLPYLKDLGVTAIEIMPVAEFPGDRGWGYDGVYLYAADRAYGGPWGLKKLIDAAHALGLAVIQDVVYNHFGPAGNYLSEYSKQYFDQEKQTPWGAALNYADPPVREFFMDNALFWTHEFHVDGLRLDATHSMPPETATSLLTDMVKQVHASLTPDRNFLFFAEDERNEPLIVTPAEQGGFGIDAVWADDFHHQVRSAIAGDNESYYVDYVGNAADIADTINKGWYYTGQKSKFSGHKRGKDAASFDPPHFVYTIQNHDQIGNRALGNRLPEDVTPAEYRAASALLLLLPYTPLLFQGQEWAASTPFLYFTNHDEELGKLVTEGRRKEFESFTAFQHAEVPDPQAPATFESSKLKWDEVNQPEHAQILALYKKLLELRKSTPALQDPLRANWNAVELGEYFFAVRYHAAEGADDFLLLVNLKGEVDVDLSGQAIAIAPEGKSWQVALSSEDPQFGGSLAIADLQKTLAENRFTVAGPVAVALQAVSLG